MEFDEYEYLEKMTEANDTATKAANNNTNTNSSSHVTSEVGNNNNHNGNDRDSRRNSSYKRRSGDTSDVHDHRSKRTRAEDDETEKERGEKERDRSSRSVRGGDHGEDRGQEKEKEKERGSRSSRSDKGREVEKEASRQQREGREGSVKKSSEKPRSREKERDRERDKEKEKERDRSRDRHRSRDKDREREREKELREREREREREKEREKERAEREKDREREHRRRSRELKERKEEQVANEPEADPERDQRTVFAYQISLKADERDVYDFFSRAGKVRDVRLIMDRNSRRSKGVGYIEFYDAMSVPMAIALSGQLLLNQPVMVKPSEAEKNLVQSTTAVPGVAGGFIGPYSGGARRLYVGNLHFNMTEDQLRQVFEPFGPVELVQLPSDLETGQSKGFGFVQYARLEDARAAQQSLNGLELAGRPIKVSAVSDQIGMEDMGVHPGELDDDEGGGLSLNARSRALLMQKLDRSGSGTSNAPAPLPATSAPALGLLGTAVPPAVTPLVRPPFFVQNPMLVAGATSGLGAAALGSPGLVVPPVSAAVDAIGQPSEYLLLKNMFDPTSESDPDFDLDIKEDVQEECSKFGAVKHIFVDKNSAGHVYLCFDSIAAAMSAQRALHGRWFAGKMITATYMSAAAYQTKFPESR